MIDTAETTPEPSRARELRRPGAGANPPPGDWSRRLRAIAPRYALLGALLVVIIVFSLLRPEAFPTADNVRAMLRTAAPLLIVAMGLTAVLAAGDFDLSIAGMMGLSGAIAVALMSKSGVAWPVAGLVAVMAGVGVGLLNGVMVAYGGASSFIITLAMGTACTGLEFLVTGQKTIFENIPVAYTQLGTGTAFLGVPLTVYAAAAFAVVAWIGLAHSEIGRYLYAIGGNAEASRIAGLRVEVLRVLAFVIVAASAALAGLALTAAAGSSTPQQGLPFLLPAFAAVFLGSAVFRLGYFNPLGTVVGVMFLTVIQSGLLVLNLSTAVINLTQGGILAGAVLLSRLGARTN